MLLLGASRRRLHTTLTVRKNGRSFHFVACNACSGESREHNGRCWLHRFLSSSSSWGSGALLQAQVRRASSRQVQLLCSGMASCGAPGCMLMVVLVRNLLLLLFGCGVVSGGLDRPMQHQQSEGQSNHLQQK